MRQGLAFGTAAAAIGVALGVLWFAIAPNPAYAMGQVAETIRQARSYEYTMTTEMSLAGQPGKAPVKAEMKGRFCWVAPGSYRIETQVGNAMAGQDSLLILPAGKPGVEIDRKARKFVRQPARLGQISPLMMVEKLSMFSGRRTACWERRRSTARPPRGSRSRRERSTPTSTPVPWKSGSTPGRACLS